jgi:hypothetical protein
MSRNMIQANTNIFRLLDVFCEVRDYRLRNAGSPRWIATNAADRELLKGAILSGFLRLGPGRSLVRFDLGPAALICSVGFDHVTAQAGLVEIDVHPGLLTTVLAETLPRPRATVSEIVDVVEAFDKDSDPGYAGHDAGSVGSLFPSIRAFSGLDLADEETWRIFFLLCLDEVMRGETWIEESFANTLRAIAELGSIDVPYKTLCRSIFDADPAAMFLALYRCIESLYAYSSAREIIEALGLGLGDRVRVELRQR